MSLFPILFPSVISVPVINTLPYQKQASGGKVSLGSHFQVAVHPEGSQGRDHGGAGWLKPRLTAGLAKFLVYPWTTCPGNGAAQGSINN